jgi:hypothetical protein
MVPAMRWLLVSFALALPAHAEHARLAGARGTLFAEGAPLLLSLVDPGGRVHARLEPGGLGWSDAAGERHEVGALLRAEPRGNALALALAAAGGEATLLARWRGERTLELIFTPPPGADVASLEARLALAPEEAIWGLTERIHDGWSLPVGPEAAPIDLVPRERGGLDRRGETVAMWVRPTVAAYAPFLTSSNGYGLLVDGTWPGQFDLGATASGVLSLRFESGQPPQLHLFLFLGEPREVVDAYTALTGRPRRPPDWALGHWIWHDEHSVAAPALVDGVAMNTEVAEDLRWHETLGLPAGVYLFDRPWEPGKFGFGALPLRFDPERFPNAKAMLGALTARGWQTMVWSAAFAIDGNAEGLLLEQRVEVSSPHTVGTWTLNDCRIPPDRLIG